MTNEKLTIINSDKLRCYLCDNNLKGSIWNDIIIALQYNKHDSGRVRHNITQYYCVKCMTRGNKRHSRTIKELDIFVENTLRNQIKRWRNRVYFKELWYNYREIMYELYTRNIHPIVYTAGNIRRHTNNKSYYTISSFVSKIWFHLRL